MVFSKKSIKRYNSLGKSRKDGKMDRWRVRGTKEYMVRVWSNSNLCMQQETTLCPHGTTPPPNYIIICIDNIVFIRVIVMIK